MNVQFITGKSYHWSRVSPAEHRPRPRLGFGRSGAGAQEYALLSFQVRLPLPPWGRETTL